MSASILPMLQIFLALTVGSVPSAPAENMGVPVPVAKPSAPLFWQDPLNDWRLILSSYEAERGIYELCGQQPQSCPWRNVAEWQKFLASHQDQLPLKKLVAVNDWINQFPYKEDRWLYQTSDHWAGPRQFLERSGDCEDFVIAKYFSLKELGFKAADMRVLMVYDVFSGTDHALLRVKLDDRIYFLDNRKTIMNEAAFEERYRPHYAFNEADVWTYDRPLMARSMRGDDTRIMPGNR